MPIDVLRDALINVEEVADRFKRPGGKPRYLKSVMRWIQIGIKATHGGNPVRLEAVRVGGTWYTTEDAIVDFSRATTSHGMIESPKESRPTKGRKMSAAHERATARLRAKGVMK